MPITFGPDVFPACCPHSVTAPRDRLPSLSLPADDPFFRTWYVSPTSVARVTCIAFRQPTRVRGVPRYRVTEIFYRRGDKSTETVVLFLPDTAALLPSRVAWEKQQATYRQALQAKLNPVAAAQDEKARRTRGRQPELCCVACCLVLQEGTVRWRRSRYRNCRTSGRRDVATGISVQNFWMLVISTSYSYC